MRYLSTGGASRRACAAAGSKAHRTLSAMVSALGRDIDHPADAEAIRQHAEARREKSLAQRRLHLAAIAERGEDSIGLGLVRHRERQREALEAGLALAVPVG